MWCFSIAVSSKRRTCANTIGRCEIVFDIGAGLKQCFAGWEVERCADDGHPRRRMADRKDARRDFCRARGGLQQSIFRFQYGSVSCFNTLSTLGGVVGKLLRKLWHSSSLRANGSVIEFHAIGIGSVTVYVRQNRVQLPGNPPPITRSRATASQGNRALSRLNNTSHRDSSLYALVSTPHSAAYMVSTYHLASGNLQVLRDRG
jgi:hypothetical protein